MPTEALNISSLLCRAFSKEELDYLKAHEEFSVALHTANSHADLETLWEIAERLLDERDDALQTNPRPRS